MGCGDKLISNVPLESGALVLHGRGCNPDVRVPAGAAAGAVDVLVAASSQVRGVQVAELAGAYDVGGEIVAGQYAVFLDGGRVALVPAGADAMRAVASRFN